MFADLGLPPQAIDQSPHPGVKSVIFFVFLASLAVNCSLVIGLRPGCVFRS